MALHNQSLQLKQLRDENKIEKKNYLGIVGVFLRKDLIMVFLSFGVKVNGFGLVFVFRSLPPS